MKNIYKTLGLTLLIVSSFLANAQITKLKDIVGEGVNGRNKSDYFGNAIAISDDIMVVSTPYQDFDETGANEVPDAGAAYVFYRNEGGSNNWGLKRKLVAGGINGRQTGGYFGTSVAISGNTIVVGATSDRYDANGSNLMYYAGAAYIFQKDEGGADNWGLVKKITPTGKNARNYENYFGWSVCIENDIIVVGATQNDFDADGMDSVYRAGAAYIFYKDEGGINNWGQKKKLVGTGINARSFEDFFGSSLAISNNIIVVGAYGHSYDEAGTNKKRAPGAAFVFYRNEGGADNWGLKKKLAGTGINGRNDYDGFGWSADIAEDIIVIGAARHDYDANGTDSITDAGAAYIFYKNEGGPDNWGIKKKISAAPASRNQTDLFGLSLAATPTTIAIGAPWHNYDGANNNSLPDAGAVYIYKKDEGGTDNWGQTTKLAASGRSSQDYFGSGIAMSDNFLLVGSNAPNASPSNAGKVSVYNLVDNTNGFKETNTLQEVFVSSENKNILINFQKNEHYTIVISDLLGRTITETTTADMGLKTIYLPYASTGYYTVKISNSTHQQVFKTYLH